MPLSLFGNNFRYTEIASGFDNEVHAALRPIMERYISAGYSPRELCYLVGQVANDISLCSLLCDFPPTPPSNR